MQSQESMLILENKIDIHNIQDMWNAAIAHQKNGDYDTTAMADIYRRMDPNLTMKDIANVFSAVYADNYWNGIKMDSSLLAACMVKSVGYDPALAQQYASSAMLQWRGILIRRLQSDQGKIPEDDNCNCLDIVCNENTPLDAEQLITNWNNKFWNRSQTDKNYVYVRCQNLQFLGTITPKVKVFNADPGFNQRPSDWVQLETVNTGDIEGVVNLISGSQGPMDVNVRGVSEAFMFDPKTAKHSCLVAAITTDFFTKSDPLTISGNWDAATWRRNNGASGWLNVDPIAVESTLKFNNLDGRPEKFAFEAHCSKVPEGTMVAIRSKDSQLSDIDSGAVRVSRKFQIISTEGVVPANYKGDLEVLIKTPDNMPIPKESSVEVKMIWILDHSHDRYLDAADMLDFNEGARALRSVRVPMGSFTFMGSLNE
jgi:hypothetical protein